MNARALVSLVFVALAGCPAPVPEPLEKAPRIVAFTASRTLVNAGEAVTLGWETADATSVRLEDAARGPVADTLEGSLEVVVEKTSLFVLTARNARGATTREVIAVTVRGAASDALLTAMPSLVDVGQAVTLAWSAAGATELSLTATPGGAIDVGAQRETGSVTVTPGETTTYTLTADTRTASVTVTVRPTILSFTASTDAVDPTDAGASVALAWSAANATRVRLLTPGRAALVDSTDVSVVADGGFTDVLAAPIDASRLYRYELVVERADAAPVSRVLTLPVRGNPGIDSIVAPRRARIGRDFELSWTTTGAESLSIYEDGVELHRTPNAQAAAAGRLTLTAPSHDLTLQFVARGARAGVTTDFIEVEVVGAPAISLASAPATVTRATPYQLTWSGQYVRNVRVFDADGRALHVGDDVTDTGAVPLTFNAGDAHTFHVVADNGLGEFATARATVTPTDAFVFTPSVTGTIPAGRRVSLSWAGGETVYGFPHDDVTVRTGSTGFDDISLTGTPVNFSGTNRDDEIGPIVTTFRAPFYGRIVGDVINVSTNGYITFGPGNRTNYLDVPLPTTKLERLSLAPYWEDLKLLNGEVRWQVKQAGADEVLIVQWINATAGATPGNSFQLKLFSSGRVDFEYQLINVTGGRAGVQGPRGDEGVVVPVAPASNLGVTLLAPRQSPLSFPVRSRLPYGGFLRDGARWVSVSAAFDVVFPEELQLNEVQLEPVAAVGPAGRWLELFNARSSPIELDGWTLEVADGGASPLSGTVPARGVRVFGASTDRSLNDDAGVDVALAGFEVSGSSGSFTWGRDGVVGEHTWTNASTGFAQVLDPGPYRFAADAEATPSRGQRCTASQAYGAQQPPQRGSPGAPTSCGFGYGWERIAPGYFDVSERGQRITTTTVLNVDLSAAPFPFFGTPRGAVRVSGHGYLTFDLASPNITFTSNRPSVAAPNSLIAVYGNDMGDGRPNAGMFVHRAAQNEDPWAAAPHWVFQWHHWSRGTGDDLNFQVKLFDDGVIEYHFGHMDSAGTVTPHGSGESASTWLENATGTQALVINAQSTTPGISAFTAFRFFPR